MAFIGRQLEKSMFPFRKTALACDYIRNVLPHFGAKGSHFIFKFTDKRQVFIVGLIDSSVLCRVKPIYNLYLCSVMSAKHFWQCHQLLLLHCFATPLPQKQLHENTNSPDACIRPLVDPRCADWRRNELHKQPVYKQASSAGYSITSAALNMSTIVPIQVHPFSTLAAQANNQANNVPVCIATE